MLLVEYTLLDKLQVINETTEGGQSRLKLRGRFQKCDEQNNNGRIYPRAILENQVKKIQEKINDRSLVGALDHPANDAIHLSQASHLITGLSVDKSGDVIGECEILSTPNGKIVEALINDGVKIGISSRGVGSVSEGREGKIVNEDFKLITFDLVSDPSTKGAYPELTESIRENSQRAQAIVSKHKKQRVLTTLLESKINQKLDEAKKKKTVNLGSARVKQRQAERAAKRARLNADRVAQVSRQEGKVDLGSARVAQRRAERAAEIARRNADAVARGDVDDSVQLFGDMIRERFKLVAASILESFPGLDPKARAKRVKKVGRGLKIKGLLQRLTPNIEPGGENAAADKLDLLGRHALAAGARSGVFTGPKPNPNKPTTDQRIAKNKARQQKTK